MKFSLFGFILSIRRQPTTTEVLSRFKRERIAKPSVKGECSDEFWDAFQMGGGLHAECSFCCRQHAAIESDFDWEDGEREAILAAAEKEPDKWVLDYRNSSIAYLELGGKILPWGCPCGSGKPYENFILDHAEQIVRFLRETFRREFVDAESNHKAISTLSLDLDLWLKAKRKEELIVEGVAAQLKGTAA